MPTGVYMRSAEYRAIMSAAMKGRSPANLPSLIETGTATRFRKGQEARNKGMRMSDEQRAKCIAAWKLRSYVAPDLEPIPPVRLGLVLSHASLNTRRWRAAAFMILGKRCVFCGFDDVRALQIDHINGGGRRDRAKFNGSPRAFYKAVIKDEGHAYQLLCANCNQIKRVERGE